MTSMQSRQPYSALIATLLVFSWLFASCSDDSPTPTVEEPAPMVEPGVGVHFDDALLQLGDEFDDIQALFGPIENLRDFGSLGVRFDYADLGLSGLLTWSDNAATVVRVTLYAESGATLSNGVGIGSSEADVRAAFGEGIRDPFLDVWWYTASGVGFEWGPDGVAQIHLVESDG